MMGPEYFLNALYVVSTLAAGDRIKYKSLMGLLIKVEKACWIYQCSSTQQSQPKWK